LSKEIAQTVGNKKFGLLIALLLALAVFATLGSQWRKSEALLPQTTATLSQNPAAAPSGSINPGSTITYTLAVTTTRA